jgi:hypothetical protein
VLLSEEELVETALLRYAQQRATKWGAERFAAEFERRDREERWLKAVESNTFHAPALIDAEDATRPAMKSGLVDASVQERVIGSGREDLALSRPKYSRHPSVPRPPAPEPEGNGRRRRQRRRERRTTSSGWMITAAEAARMSPASRRLYGLDDQPIGSPARSRLRDP